MAFEDLMTRVDMLLTGMVNQPEDRHELALHIRELVQELTAAGMPIPEDLRRLEAQLDSDEMGAAGAQVGAEPAPRRPARSRPLK